MKTVQQFVDDLREEVEAHPAVNHLFLNRLATAPFSKSDYRVFAENHDAVAFWTTLGLRPRIVQMVGPIDGP